MMATLPEIEVLDGEFLAAQEARLRAEREEIAHVVDGLAAEINGLTLRRETGGAEEGFGRVDTSSVDLDRARGQHAKTVTRLAETDAALARLQAGTYG